MKLYREMGSAGVLPNNMVFGQMNEPPGAWFRVGHAALTMAEYFRDDIGQDVLLLIDNIFLFIALSNLLSVVPGFITPTGSLSTTAALALMVFLAVPGYGISEVGLISYLRNYLRPTSFMLPFSWKNNYSPLSGNSVRRA